MEASYRKDLSHITWDEVFARQVKRAALVVDWMNDLELRPGARVLDVGAGPGYVSLVLAERVGPEGGRVRGGSLGRGPRLPGTPPA